MLFGIFSLPKDVAESKDAAQPWRALLSMVDQNTALWAFAFVAFAYILWMDVRPWVQRKLKERKAAKYFDPPDVVAAKSKILALAGNQLRLATDKVREAVRLSAYVPLKERVARLYAPRVVAQVVGHLEGKDEAATAGKAAQQ